MNLTMPEMIIASVVLLFVATLSSVVFKRLKIPYTIGLVLVGILFYNFCGVIPAFEQFRHLRLNYDLIMFALLPSLIFSAAINIDSKLLFRNLNPTFLLAGPGLIISTLITSAIMYYLTPLDLSGSLLFGALISATDPVAVISLFEIVGAPKRLRMLVDGESLFNGRDCDCCVCFDTKSRACRKCLYYIHARSRGWRFYTYILWRILCRSSGWIYYVADSTFGQ